MMCLICRQAETITGLVAVRFKRGEMKLTVNNVPALVCSACEEAYLDEKETIQLLSYAEKIFADGH
jgi:YgiT-type zinc finger domain-containing protein